MMILSEVLVALLAREFGEDDDCRALLRWLGGVRGVGKLWAVCEWSAMDVQKDCILRAPICIRITSIDSVSLCLSFASRGVVLDG